MRGRERFGLIRRMSAPALAALFGLALVGGAKAAPAPPGGTAVIAGAAAVSMPIAAVAGDRRESRERTGEGRRTRTRVVYRPYYGSFGWYGVWGSYWPYYFSPYAVGPYAWGPGAVGYAAPNAGALDINTRPKKASVYLDGELIGRVDSFDGFPRYLWLREGSYRLAIFMDGHETLEREIRVRPGVVIKIDQDLVPGNAVRPQPPAPEPAAPEPVAERTAAPGESWRVENRGQPIRQDQRSEPARLLVEVEPPDAVVYLDGRLLGSGAQLANLHSPLIVDSGAHRLEVTRPGYATAVREFEAAKGEDVLLRIELGRE
ncbi:MAG: PEGA domain-containing protein [Acidobacteria bacterium]|nr:PEGA domain-containing protein [Acidobacteriota bacterium]